jgi:hypothetical protein
MSPVFSVRSGDIMVAVLDLVVGANAAGPVGGEALGMLALAVHARAPVDRLPMMILT